MVDTLVSGASASRRVGSTPIMRTRPGLLTGLFYVCISEELQKVIIFTECKTYCYEDSFS